VIRPNQRSTWFGQDELGRSVVDVVSGPLRYPSPYLGVFVGGVVVHDEVNVEFSRDTSTQTAFRNERNS
jgi:hypothetical protein